MIMNHKKIGIFLLLIVCLFSVSRVQAAKKLDVKIPDTDLKAGEQVQIKVKNSEDVFYKSMDSKIACVNENGLVTAKRKGTVTIRISSDGFSDAKIKLNVEKKKRKPVLPVALDEVVFTREKMEQQEDGSFIYAVKVKNKAKKGKIRRAEYYYNIEILEHVQEGSLEVINASGGSIVSGGAIEDTEPDRKKKQVRVCLTIKNLDAGETSDWIECRGDCSGSVEAMQADKIKLYTGQALYVYSAESGTCKLKWGTEDTVAPKIIGWIKKKSIYSKSAIRICYSNQKKTYRFTRNVQAYDDRDGKVKVKVDTSKVKWKKNGTYKIYYTAKDKAGNQAKAWAKIQVYKPGTPESIADQILKKITKKNWSKTKKARKIYKYIRAHCHYVGNRKHLSWRDEAVHGFRYNSGDCYTYYSMAKLLLTRAGIPNLQVKRYKSTSRHFWNLVYVQDGWYHFDTTPRSSGGKFCLNTDKQMNDYAPGSYVFRFNKKILPKRATKVISKTPRKG